ncbi:MAG: CAP domain-containing protein [Thermomicrobiales bacterium]|nr:CAP domain-containing protein [Thermomicrobiales bacterium]
MRRFAVVFASFMLVFGLLTMVSPATTVHAQDSGYAPDDQEAAFLDLINSYRASLGIGPLSLNYQLGAAADYHSYDMATNNYFDHYLFDGTDPATNMRNFGYGGSTTGENIAAGMASAQEVMIAWQNSPEHDAGMRNPNFTEIGVGRVYNENSHYGWYWTTTFGGGGAQAPVDQAPVDAVPVETLNTQTEPAPLIDPNTAQVSGNGDLSGSTTTWQEPGSVTTNGNVVELPQNAVDADGRAATATGNNPVADGTGETVIYGDINTGGVQGETIVYEEPSLSVTGGPAPAAEPVYTETTYVEPVYTEPAYSAPVTMTDQTMSETTTTNISMADGNGRAIGG